tara:strand:+ start:1975 stop:2334 length:360 start_codon:yes stop_codon:yes gene_type:complete
MSDQLENISSPIKKEVAQKIQELDLPLIQKHHVRLLIHCLEVFKNIASTNEIAFPNDILLMEWCELEAKKINDNEFRNLLFDQMNAAAQKLESHSKKIGKNILDFNLDDLVNLVCNDYR